jgi:hypothetical protein
MQFDETKNEWIVTIDDLRRAHAYGVTELSAEKLKALLAWAIAQIEKVA